MNGNLSSSFGMFGPGSDLKSISSLLFNMDNLTQLKSKCSIPYCFDEKEQYYCKRLTTRKDLGCMNQNCPATLNLKEPNYGKCNLGYYVMITSDKYQNEFGSLKSRLFSPVYGGIRDLCCKFYYNIRGSDGFYFYIEDFEHTNQNMNIFKKFGLLDIDKWYEVNVQLNNIPFEQFRVIMMNFS